MGQALCKKLERVEADGQKIALKYDSLRWCYVPVTN